jgi:hypothetical protein
MAQDILDEIFDDGLPSDPIERAKLLSKDPVFLAKYKEEQLLRSLDSHLRILNERGIYPQSHELPRPEYLANLSTSEQSVLSSFLESVWVKSARDVNYGIIAVGTSTFRKSDFDYLKVLLNIPNATFNEYETNYADQTEPVFRQPFNLETILSKLGEDIDIKFIPASKQDDLSKVRDVIIDYATAQNIPFSLVKERNLAGTNYEVEPPFAMLKEGDSVEVRRIKLLSDFDCDSIILHFVDSRPVHCYFDSTFLMHDKLDYERSESFNFTTLVYNGNVPELVETIKHGQKTGVFEHPAIIDYNKSITK